MKSKIVVFWLYILTFILVAIKANYCQNIEDIDSGYNKAIKSDINSIKICIKNIDKDLEKNPDNAMLKIYKGSLEAKLADKEILFWDKLIHVNDGIVIMKNAMQIIDNDNKGIYSDKEKLKMYLTRGITSAYIPSTFQSHDIAIYELKRAKDSILFKDVPKDIQFETLELLIKLYKEKNMGQEVDNCQRELEKSQG